VSELQHLRACLDGRHLQLILLPTEACNFRCTYCYESFKLGRMQPWVARGVKNLLAARIDDLDRLALSWFGGEPLLALDRIEEIGAHARELCAAHPRVRLRSDVTTNGWLLTPDVFTRLLDLGVGHFQISFDGPPEHHDRKRVLAGGGPTFERVWANVLATRAVERPFQISLRVHVDKSNVALMPAFLERVHAEFGRDPRYGTLLKPLQRYGGPNDDGLDVLDGDGLDEVAVLRRSEQDRLPAAPGAPGGTPCHAAQAGSYVIRADGRVEKCTVALDHPANLVGRLAEDGTLAIDAASHRRWLRGAFSGDRFELFCPLWGIDAPSAELAAPAA
jgi:uncharacterized protein